MDKFKLLSGRPSKYIKTAESGSRHARMFCPDCGTTVYSTGVGGEPPFYAALADRPRLLTQNREAISSPAPSPAPGDAGRVGMSELLVVGRSYT